MLSVWLRVSLHYNRFPERFFILQTHSLPTADSFHQCICVQLMSWAKSHILCCDIYLQICPKFQCDSQCDQWYGKQNGSVGPSGALLFPMLQSVEALQRLWWCLQEICYFLTIWDSRFTPYCNMALKSVSQHGVFIKQLVEPGSRVFVEASVVLSVCPLECTTFSLWLQLQIQGNKHEWKGFCASVPGKAVPTQPICELQSLCNSLPLSGERMYLSNHLNYYNHFWDGNAWISALTLWNFQGPESMPRWVLMSLQNRIMLWEISLSKLMGLNQNQQTKVEPGYNL